MVSALALSVAVSRTLGAEALGLQSLLSYIQGFVLNTFVLSLSQAGIQLLSRARGADDRAALHWLRRWSLQVHAIVGVVLAGLLLGLGGLRDESPLLWGVIAGTALVDAVAYAFTVRVVTYDGWARVSRRRLVSQGLGPLLGVAAVLGGLGITGVFVGQAVGSLYLLVALLVLQRRVPRAPAGGPRPPVAPVARVWLGFVLTLALTQVVERRVELVFLDLFSGARQVGLFSAAFTLVSVAVAASAAVTGAAMPAVARTHAAGGAQQLDVLVGRALRVLAAGSPVLVVGLVVLGPSAVVALYGPGLADAGPLLRGLALVLLAAPLAGALAAVHLGVGRVHVVVRAGLAAAATDVGLCLALVPALAAAGAVVASVTAQVVYLSTLVLASRREPSTRSLRPSLLLRPLVVAAAAGGAAAVPAALLAPWPAVVVGGALFVVVLAAAARVLRPLGAEDGRWLAEVLPGPLGRLLPAVSRR
ncbi:polysaccharide biosynthesis C-terminal domain-containing protein [Pseudokineococcus basanitobsidens]|uniref:Polysaccharide biosynthesis C-terminal domain-containing protein n=1 Tax=Pseudokineococcus basanitobsidens TaxID=1926649 RepID=A0ABU8RJP3_9ACTN